MSDYDQSIRGHAAARSMSEREQQRHHDNDTATQYACALGAMTAHLGDMYARYGVPESHRDLINPVGPGEAGQGRKRDPQ